MTASSRTLAAVSLALVFAVLFGGCGRRGALEAPPGAAAPAAKVASEDEDERPTMPKGVGLIQDFTPGAAPTSKPKKDKTQRVSPAPARGSFFLDPLL
jgi:predicted small lipoprotein YifL